VRRRSGRSPRDPNEMRTQLAAGQKIRRDLINAELRHQTDPNTWDLPTAEALRGIRLGQNIKVGVEGPWGGERFWCTVLAVSETGYLLKVNNGLIFTAKHGLQYGDVVSASSKHIINVQSCDGTEAFKPAVDAMGSECYRNRTPGDEMRMDGELE